jgi:hypothetical protein
MTDANVTKTSIPAAAEAADSAGENCSIRHCDLPGQYRSEGACHHPAESAVEARTGENCTVVQTGPTTHHELYEPAPAADAGIPRTDAIAGKHFTIHYLPNYWYEFDRWVKHDDVCAILSHAGELERELSSANARIHELEARHEADCATLAKQAAKIGELENNERAYERIVGRKTYREVAEEITQLTDRLAAAEKAIITMAGDGCMYHGPEGMSEAQVLFDKAYRVAMGMKNG